MITLPAGYESGAFEWPTSVGVITRRVLRRTAPGPTVILMHEAPGLADSTFGIAQRLHDDGFTVVLPELLDAPASWPATMVRLCIARELGALSRGETGAIVDWLRALVDREYEAAGKRPVGVVGMCFSGGFALAATYNPHVGAAVSSQPALPFSLSAHGISPGEYDVINQRVADGTCVRALRYRLDWRSPGPRLRRLKRDMPTIDRVVIPSWNPKRHSVLADGLAGRSPRVALEFEKTLEFLGSSLGWPLPADPVADRA